VLYDYQVPIPGISHLNILKFNARLRNSNLRSVFYKGIDAINICSYNERVLMTALLGMIDR